jgi:hypothetical protein
VASGAVEVEWRAVVDDSGIATSREQVTGELATLFD